MYAHNSGELLQQLLDIFVDDVFFEVADELWVDEYLCAYYVTFVVIFEY